MKIRDNVFNLKLKEKTENKPQGNKPQAASTREGKNLLLEKKFEADFLSSFHKLRLNNSFYNNQIQGWQTSPEKNFIAQQTPLGDFDQIAQQWIQEEDNDGDVSKEAAHRLGKRAAELALTDPASAALIYLSLRESIAENDRNELDNLASGFSENLEIGQMVAVANIPGGYQAMSQMVYDITNIDNFQGKEKNQALELVQALALSGGLNPATFTNIEGLFENLVIEPGSPEEAAHQFASGDLNEREFTETLNAHQGDPEWLNRFYASLGTNRTAEILTKIEDNPQAQEAVTTSLNTLAQNGLLNQTDLDVLMTTTLSKGGADAVQIFSNMFNSSLAGPEMKTMLTQTMFEVVNGHLPVAVPNDESLLISSLLMVNFANNPAEFEQLLGTIPRPRLTEIIRFITEKENSEFPSIGRLSQPVPDNFPITSILLDATAQITNPSLKAIVFEAVSTSNSVEKEMILSQLNSIVLSDTNGVMTALENDYPYGDGITAFSENMIKNERFEELSQIYAQLQFGNDLSGNPFTNFTTQVPGDDGELFSQNAQTLGYFNGGLQAGLENVTSDKEEQAEYLSNFFNSTLGAIPVAGSAAAALSDAITNVITKLENDQFAIPIDSLLSLAYPLNPIDGTHYNGKSEGDFQSSYNAVLEHQRIGD